MVGVVSVGEVPKTAAPLPVSLVSAVARLALVGVARNVATPVPNPLTPVLIGSPVQLVSVPVRAPDKTTFEALMVGTTSVPVPELSVIVLLPLESLSARATPAVPS